MQGPCSSKKCQKSPMILPLLETTDLLLICSVKFPATATSANLNLPFTFSMALHSAQGQHHTKQCWLNLERSVGRFLRIPS